MPAAAQPAWRAGRGGLPSFIDLDARIVIGHVPSHWISGTSAQVRSGQNVRP